MGPMDKAHLIAGPILKPKLKRLKQHWDYLNWVFYGSVKPEVLQKWLDRWSIEDVFTFWCDFSMFDCTHSDESIDNATDYYEEMKDPEFRKVMNAWKKPKGKIGEIKFQAGVMLPSGVDDTAIRNAVTNGLPMAVSIAAALEKKRVWTVTVDDLVQASQICGFSVCGDDTLGFLPMSLWPDHERLMGEIERNLCDFGFVPKLDCSNYLGHAVYLGQRPYNVPFEGGRKWVWGRTIGRALYKMGWMVDLAKGDPIAWVTGVAEQVALTQSHVPLLSDVAKVILGLRKGCKKRMVLADQNKPWTDGKMNVEHHNLQYDDITVMALLECYERLTYREARSGVVKHMVPTLSMVKQSRQKIGAIPRLPYIIDCPVLRFLCLSDDC